MSTVSEVHDDSRRRTSKSLDSHVLDASPDGMLVAERGGRIVYANRSMRELAGSDSSLVGRYVDELVPDAARDRHRHLRQDFEESPTPRPMGSGMELTLRRVDGREVPVEISLSPFDDAENGIHFIAAVRDVTERRETDRRLAAANQQLALGEERARIGRDLHDVVLQRLYGTGLTVQAIGAGADTATVTRLDAVVGEIDRIIAEVRTIVFTLGSAGGPGTLGQELADVIAQASRVLGFTPTVRIDGPVESVLSDEACVEMMASMREALGNVARHAAAGAAEVDIAVRGGQVVMAVSDNGVGPPNASGQPRHGNGLLNLRARAAILGGECSLSPGDERGSVLTWSVPL